MKKENLYGKTDRTKVVMSIMRTADILNRYLEIELAKYGSNPTRFGTMNALFVHGGTMTPTAISRWLFRTKHSITSMLERLDEIGLIRRERSTRDGRSVNVTVTAEGWKATKKMIPVVEQVSESSLSCLKDDELEDLMVVLKRLRGHLLKTLGS